MSPRGGRRTRRTRTAGIAAAAAIITATAALTAIYSTGGQDDLIPPAKTWAVRIDLLASRDLEVSGAIPAGGVSDTKPRVADQTWTRSGSGEVCYPISSTDASCFATDEIPYTVDATGTGWIVEPSQTTRMLYTSAINCTNWTCTGAPTIDATTAPDGSSTAATITVDGGNYISQPAPAYTPGTALYPRLWIRCSAGRLYYQAEPGWGFGRWIIDCGAIGGQWTYIGSAAHPAVSETRSWVATSGGASGVMAYGPLGAVTFSVWAPTLTEESYSDLAVIPTGASAVTTGDSTWIVDNSTGRYYVTGDTITQSITTYDGTCFATSGTDLLLTGAPGSPCAGIWYSLHIAP